MSGCYNFLLLPILLIQKSVGNSVESVSVKYVREKRTNESFLEKLATHVRVISLKFN